MSAGLAVFDTTIQDTNLWLKAVSARLADCERQDAYAGFRAVLHALRDRLPAQSAVNFAAQLPLLLRAVYFEGWTLPEHPTSWRSVNEFADTVAAQLPDRFRFDAIMTTEAVFAATAKFMSAGETEKVRAQLPEPIRDLWPHPIFV
jgi:uncharacterized protein (DUF2267 family)